MATATVHIEQVGGYAGPARCFAIDPPFQGHSYVTAWVQPGFGDIQLPEVALVPATETGAAAENSLKRRPGSFVLHEPPDTPERIEGAYWLALLMLGGYEIASGDA
ncbi:hypothetical protein [Nocardia otitidiscaviarum]|uniref:hypothetical protein n=1 Tax=Nocardia otitidiscaviarum TaxID=1823 RepID=UPI0004A6F859|nr:hypothetical protein [Nocardia otitidiscaviarum]